GCIDEANARVIRGWAWDSGTPGERIRQELVEHNTPLLTALASDNRPGLTLSEIGDGRHGFDIALPEGASLGRPAHASSALRRDRSASAGFTDHHRSAGARRSRQDRR